MADFFTRYIIEDRSYVAFVKKEIHNECVAAGFSEIDVGKIDIVVSEISSNMIKYVGSGELLYRVVISVTGPTFEIVCIDKGQGIKDIPHAMKDGNSTKGTLGGGLGSMERLSTLFQIFSIPVWGTVIYSRFGPVPMDASKSGSNVEIRVLCVPKPPEEVCGDGYAVVQDNACTKILFGDGLGHGRGAADAINTARDLFYKSGETDPVQILRELHEGVRRTRGLVATVACINKKTAEWNICGIGNINTRLYTGIEYRNYMAYNGTVGLNIPNSMKATVIPFERNQHLVMCSDGITTRWQLNRYPYIFKYDPFVVAGIIYKDFARGSDDASVLIAKVN